MTQNVPSTSWNPASWQGKPAEQQPEYADSLALSRALSELSRLPPLVVSWEVEALKAKLAEAERGERFVLQGGDCAESFDESGSESIAGKLRVLLQMSLVLTHGLEKPVLRIGRIAGQYAKPRSQSLETRGGITLPSYRGAIVNRPGFSAAERAPDPALLLRGYERAALTLNFIRALIDGGFADLHHPEYWDLQFVRYSPLRRSYQRIVETIAESLDFIEAATGRRINQAGRVDFYTSHEGLHLPYEQAQTRYVPRCQRWYNLTTHMPWIGLRTAALDGAHVEYFRGIANPIGIKIGPRMSREQLRALVEVLNPYDEPGKLSLIHRLGADEIERELPRLIEAVRASGRRVLWLCDPMHGNTESTRSGRKTRRFERILAEIEAAFRIHRELGSTLGGIHVELTGEDVTECTGGARRLGEDDLPRAYRSLVDPRLNGEQALELAMSIAATQRAPLGED